MKNLEELKAELEIAQNAVNTIRTAIRECADGFIYHVCILSYGSKRWDVATNTFLLQELCYEYGDGYDGLVHIYTNNPKLAEELNDRGCLTIFTLEELPENKRDVSQSQAFSNTIMMGVGGK